MSENLYSTTSKNTLSSNVSIIGSLKCSKDLTIDGKIDGKIFSEGNLTVGDCAEIKGEIKSKGVKVFGKIEGNVTVSGNCELKASSIFKGDVEAVSLSIEEGATFSGRSSVRKR